MNTLRELRESKKLSLRAAAKLHGSISAQTIHDWENKDASKISRENISLLAKIYEVSTETIEQLIPKELIRGVSTQKDISSIIGLLQGFDEKVSLETFLELIAICEKFKKLPSSNSIKDILKSLSADQ